jgi:hypothetical protein
MDLRMKPTGSTNPLVAYAPAFDISNFLPGLLMKVAYGLKEENWPDWLRAALAELAHLPPDGQPYCTSEDLHGGLLRYILAVKLIQTDPDIATFKQACTVTGFNDLPPLIRVFVRAQTMEFVDAMFGVAIKDATVLNEEGTPVRQDVQTALDIVEELLRR